jgi:hypothetical protein
MEWILANWDSILQAFAAAIALASLIVRLTPTLKDDNVFLPIVKFIGKYVALNKYGPPERPAE